MKKHTLALLIASTIGLTACGDETGLEGNPTVSYEPHITKSLQASTQVDFTLQGENANVPLPSFMLMDTTDGTLNIPDGGDTSLSNPAVAMGAVDGWSPSQPIIIPFTGIDLDPATAAGSVHILKVDDPRKGASMTIIGELKEGSDFVAQPKGGTLYIQPMTPFDEKSNYIFVVTNNLTDTQGNAVGMSSSYAELKTKEKVQTIESLKTAQGLTHLIEGTFALGGVDADSIIYSSWFTTASVGDVLDTTKGIIAQTIATVKAGGTPELVWKGNAKPDDLDLSSLYQMNITEETKISEFFNSNQTFKQLVGNDQTTIDAIAAAYTANGIKIYTGTVNLPYFLSDSTDNEAWKKTPWESAVPSLAKISNIMTNGSDADKAAVLASLDGIDITKLLSGDSTEFTKLIGLEITLADGSLLDKERLVTQYSPLPKIKSVAEVPVLLILPPNANPGAVVYQHGITSVKETAYLFGAQHIGAAVASSTAPKAIIAIDHPLHGARALTDGTVTTPATADVYMNLKYLNVARDNIRQSIIDDLGVRASLSVMKYLNKSVFNDINTDDISFFGHSLGAITGIGTYRLGNDLIGIEDADDLFSFTSGAFANPGGGIPSLLLESDAFGPTIKHSLLIGAKDPAYEGVCGSAEDGGACFTTFFDSLGESTQGSINATFSSFAYAAQTVLDTVDPYNLAKEVNGPVYVMQAHKDSVVPNQTTTFGMIGGTEPLAKQLGLADLKDYTGGEVKHIARFDADSKAQHSTVIGAQTVDGDKNPIDPVTAQAATDAAQLQVATFTANAGTAIVVGNSGLIDPDS